MIRRKDEDNNWILWHSYRWAVDNEYLEPLRCEIDDSELSVRGKRGHKSDLEPVLFCPSCRTSIFPNLALSLSIREKLDEIKKGFNV